MIINAAETPIIAIVLFALWTALLALCVPIWRITLVAFGQARTTDFTPGDAHGSPAYWRLNRAHANCVENLVVFAALAVSGLAAGISDPLFGQFCATVVIARFAQTLLHLASGAAPVIAVRFFTFAIQLVCYVGIAAMIFSSMTQ